MIMTDLDLPQGTTILGNFLVDFVYPHLSSTFFVPETLNIVQCIWLYVKICKSKCAFMSNYLEESA